MVSLCLPACQLGAALKPRCDQHIITMALMQIVPPTGGGLGGVGAWGFHQDGTLLRLCRPGSHLTCRDRGGAETTSLSRYIHTAPYAQIVCRLWPNRHILSLHPPTPLGSLALTTTQQPPVRGVIVEPSPHGLFHFAKNKAEHLFWLEADRAGISFHSKCM